MNVDKEIALLQQLVAVRSFSREEDGTATVIYDYLTIQSVLPAVIPGILFLRILRMVCCMVWAVMMPGLQWCRL